MRCSLNPLRLFHLYCPARVYAVVVLSIKFFFFQMCNILYMWMLEPAERDAIVARDAFECSVVNHRALIEIYTRRKTNHLFFTKQAYSALCKRNLDQDIIGEQNSPSQRVI